MCNNLNPDIVAETEEVMGTPNKDWSQYQYHNKTGEDGGDVDSVAESVASVIEPSTDFDFDSISATSSSAKKTASPKVSVCPERRVNIEITDEEYDHIRTKNLPVYFRIMKVSGRKSNLKFEKTTFVRKDTDMKRDSELRTDIDIRTGDNLSSVHRKINYFLASMNPQEFLVDKITMMHIYIVKR